MYTHACAGTDKKYKSNQTDYLSCTGQPAINQMLVLFCPISILDLQSFPKMSVVWKYNKVCIQDTGQRPDTLKTDAEKRTETCQHSNYCTRHSKLT